MVTETKVMSTMSDSQTVEQSTRSQINLRRPIREILSKIEARTMEQSVGASTWTSGNQNIRGKRGTLENKRSKNRDDMTVGTLELTTANRKTREMTSLTPRANIPTRQRREQTNIITNSRVKT